MKRILNLIIILSLFTQICNAQQIKTVEEYKVFYDSIVSRLKIAGKDTSFYIGKPFSEFVKQLDKCGVKITEVGATNYDWQKPNSQHLYGITIWFTTVEQRDFTIIHDLRQPIVYLYFNESMPYQQALSLVKKYKGHFTEEVENFYSEAVIKSILFSLPDNIYKFPNKE